MPEHRASVATNPGSRFAPPQAGSFCAVAAARLRDELEELLACFRFRDPQERKAVLTASAIKRRGPKKSADARAP